jgi:hypothetical protein
MTHIVNIKTKKLLKEKLANNESVYFEDPSVFTPNSTLSELMPVGSSLTCTNHPKRSWFASVTKTATGYKVD